MESKEEILEEIKRLKQQLKELGEQIIDFELPKNYDKMSDEEKKAYHKRQDELKRKALENMDNYSVIVNDYAIVKYPSNKTIVKKFAREVAPFSVIPLERDTFKKTVSESVREKHKQDLSDIELLIDRYNSTKAIRNDKIEFGVNFNNFIETYFSKQACKTLARLADKEFLKLENRKPDKNGNLINGEVVFQNLTEDQRKKLIKIRIKMFAEKLNKLQRIATAKVHHDSKQKIQTFLEKYGFMNNQVEFRDGSRKFTTAKSVVSSSGVDMSKIKKRRKSELKSVAETRKDRYEQAQHNIIELNVMRDKFDTFIKNFKGNGRQFSVEFQQNFPKIAKKLYDEKTKNSAMAFSSQNLMSSPISVQQHEIDKQFNEEFRKENNRLRYSAYFIPASEVAAGYFLGKRLTNEKSQAEKDLNNVQMKEYSKELKNIIAKEDLIGFETIFEGLNIGIKEKFEKNVIKRRTDFDGLSEHAKKNELKKFLSAQIEDLKQVVNKNEFFSIRTEKLERLNGVMIERKEKNENKKMKEFLEKLTPKQADLYKHLSDSVKEYSTKYDYEKVTVEKLSAKLEQVSSLPYSYENNNQIESIMKDMDAHNKKLALAKRSLDNMLERKKTFENNFAAEQINKAMESGISKSFSYNTSSSVLDKYVFPAVDAFDEVYEIQKGTIEGKQVEKIVADFVMKFKNQIQNMQISFGSVGIPEIEDYVARLKQRDDDDFGVNIRDIKKTQKFFTEQIESLKNTKKNEVVDELSKYLQRLARIEGELVKKLKSMNIEIGNVKLAKKRN